MFNLKESQNNIYHLIMDRADNKMHVIDLEFIDQFEKKIEEVQNCENLLGLIILSNHDEFIAGGDLAMLRDVSSIDECRQLTMRLHQVLRKIETL